MKIAQLTEQELDWLAIAVDTAAAEGTRFRLAYDEIDQSIKWKVGDRVWSPPVRTEEH